MRQTSPSRNVAEMLSASHVGRCTSDLSGDIVVDDELPMRQTIAAWIDSWGVVESWCREETSCVECGVEVEDSKHLRNLSKRYVWF